MAVMRIEIDTDTHGHVGWNLHVAREANSNNDTETANVNSVIMKLNDFVKQLECSNSLLSKESQWEVTCVGEPSALAKTLMKNSLN